MIRAGFDLGDYIIESEEIEAEEADLPDDVLIFGLKLKALSKYRRNKIIDQANFIMDINDEG